MDIQFDDIGITKSGVLSDTPVLTRYSSQTPPRRRRRRSATTTTYVVTAGTLVNPASSGVSSGSVTLSVSNFSVLFVK